MGSDCCKCANGNKPAIKGTAAEGSSIYRVRGDLPVPASRYRVQMRGNIVQLTLNQSQKTDTGHYALVATRVGQGVEKGSKKIHLTVEEPVSEEGDPPTFLRRLTDLAVKVGTRTRFLVEIRSSTTPKQMFKIFWVYFNASTSIRRKLNCKK
ncbi:hypothetical protein KM043_013077 [Ampulex compressa]|nr:hypothetical protein KM043_013077 [Ampulex compressa]